MSHGKTSVARPIVSLELLERCCCFYSSLVEKHMVATWGIQKRAGTHSKSPCLAAQVNIWFPVRAGWKRNWKQSLNDGGPEAAARALSFKRKYQSANPSSNHRPHQQGQMILSHCHSPASPHGLKTVNKCQAIMGSAAWQPYSGFVKLP